jgi:predicted histone-like DNA-binding protein
MIMSVYYRLQKDTRETSKTKGQYFAHAVMVETVGTDELAALMQENCTVKRSDIAAVLTELVPTMQRVLQDSKRVKLGGFGSFKIGLRGKGSATVDDFNVNKNIKGLRVNFQPEVSTDSSTGTRTKKLVGNANVTELPKNLVVGEKAAAKAKAKV